MKRNLLLLAVMALMVFGFSSVAVAQDPGTPDTLYLELYPGDDSLFMPVPTDPPGWHVQMPLYIWHDLPDVAQDSLAGIVVPLFYTSSNPAAYCSTTAYNNDKCLTTGCPPVPWVLSIFRNLPDLGETNWMWDRDSQPYPNTALAWDTRIMDLGDFVSHWWLTIATSGSEDQRMWEGTHILLATMTFNIQDSTTICVDTGFWEPSSRLQFGAGVTPTYTYIPQFEGLCVEAFIVPNIPPVAGCPGNQSYNTSGTKTVTGVTGTDVDGVITGATVQLTTSCGQVSNVQLINEAGLNTASYTADVQFDVDHCAQCTDVIKVTVNDDGGATDDCTFEVTCTNTDPTVNAGGDKTGAYNVQLCSDDIVTGDVDGDVVTWDFTVDPTPDGTMQKVGEKVCFDATCDDVSITYTVTVTATDVCGGQATDAMTMHVTNADPTVVCPEDVEEYWSPGDPPLKSGDFDADDPEGEPLIITVSAVPATVSEPVIVNDHVEWTPTEGELCQTFTMTVTVEDECGLTATCDFTMHAKEITGRMAAVVIPNKVYERFGFGHWDYFPWDMPDNDNYIILDDKCPPYNGISPGDWFEIPILLEGFGDITGVYIGGFELEVEFDYIDLTFYGAMRGCLLSQRWYEEDPGPPLDSILYSWEYFSYRVMPCNIPACHKYKILLFGQADMPDGPYRRGYSLGDGDLPHSWWCVDSTDDDMEIGASLVWLKFRVANNELLRDLKLPVFFEWEHKLSASPPYVIIQDWDCAENTMSDPLGEILYVSKNTMQYNPEVCGYGVIDTLGFVDGGVHICSPCTAFTCVRGDINHDGLPYTTADAVLFARYFVEGINVFVVDLDEQICASDVNADGRSLMLADLIYLIRVILQDAAEIPKLAPSSEVANVIVSNNTITTECAAPIAAILFEFDGTVQPTLLANMEMVNKGNKVLVWSTTGNTITTAEVLSFTGDAELVSVTAVDYDSRDLQTSITAKVAPTAFALNPAYPNPFNPFTNLSFTLPEAVSYNLNIYNVAGQLVRSYEGMGSVGLNVITWDGKDNTGVEVASGVYFCKLTAADFSATEKMVMMK